MGERIPFRGGLTCSCVVESLPWVEFDLALRGLPSPVRIFQLGYRSDVSASAGTHRRGGCVDVDGTPTAAEIDVWRLWGWTMQARYLPGITPHCHGWPYRCPHLSPAAADQEDDWDRKDAGLQGSGKVQGRWPVKPWNIALKEQKVSIAKDIADELAGNDAFLKAVATAVWERDIIPSVPADPGNLTTKAKNSQAEIERDTKAIRAHLGV